MGKEAVFSLVERGGKVRSHHVPAVDARTLRPILEAQLDEDSYLMTDGEGQYRILGPMFAKHEAVNHGIGEYVRGDAHTNTVEGYFSILKRGIVGTYHHVSPAALEAVSRRVRFPLQRALGARRRRCGARRPRRVRGTVGKRVTYQSTNREGATAAH